MAGGFFCVNGERQEGRARGVVIMCWMTLALPEN